MNSPLSDPVAVASGAAPTAWLLFGKYHGDNGQVQGLGEALAAAYGWRTEIKRIRFKPLETVPRERIPEAIDIARSSPLDPPWPDAVIACSRFYGQVAHWLKQRSGGRILHIQLGRFGSPFADIDVMATTAQYGIPDGPNVVSLTLPIIPHRPERGAEAAAAWLPRLAHLPRPWTVVLVGGEIALIPFGIPEAELVATRAIEAGRRNGGTLLVAYSQRTRQQNRRAIHAALAASGLPHIEFDWPPPEPNPYPALLALADRFLVTCDSASMIADACSTGRPLDLIPLPIRDYVNRLSARGLGLSLDARRRGRNRAGKPADALDRFRDTLVRKRWMRSWDDIRDFLFRLEQAGLLSSPQSTQGNAAGPAIQQRELDLITGQIQQLLQARRAKDGAA